MNTQRGGIDIGDIQREINAALRWAKRWASRGHGLCLGRFVMIHPLDSSAGAEWVASDLRYPAAFVTAWRVGCHAPRVEEASHSCDTIRQFGGPRYPSEDALMKTDSRSTWGFSCRGLSDE